MSEQPIYFHELPQSTVNQLLAENKRWDWVQEHYRQPIWCTYPQALSGGAGCWSLCDLNENGRRNKISRAFCQGCDLYREN